jgi:S-adenosylmethionine:tRNA ribosyltransferase-isomerase
MSVLYLCKKNIQDRLMVFKEHPGQLKIGNFNYTLPEDRIAQFPLEIRDRSKLLIYRNRLVSEDVFSNLACHLPDHSLVIFNETRVIHARLIFQKESGSQVEIFCLEPLAPFRDHQQAFQKKEQADWHCLVGNSKRWKSGRLEMDIIDGELSLRITAERVNRLQDGISHIRFSWSPSDLTFAEVLDRAGKIPLPPYISRDPVKKDNETYQTIYARQDGSVAAPTAGLHFSPEVMSSLNEKDIDLLKLTLHVGAGTFRPVMSDHLSGHEMHAESIYLELESLEHLRSSLGKTIVAVGTTTTRLLESIYWQGVKIIRGLDDKPVLNVCQWDPYNLPEFPEISREDALDAIIDLCKKNKMGTLQGTTSLLIAPGYKFRFPDILITNFHQPKSTLLLLIAAFIGEDWKKAYQYALDHEFRFLSYGDSCIFFKHC